MKARIFEIKRFAVHDGDGIRTTVFFAGCPLRCVWCHNPEGLSTTPKLAYYEHKCVGCGECAQACPEGAHRFEKDEHIFDREKCVSCGKCVQVCPDDVLKIYINEITVEKLLPLLLEDRDFYEGSGGVTLSGGECLLQADFCAELLRNLKEQGINTAVDTCGHVKKEALDKVIPFTDTFLYDVKAFDEDVHIRCTGVSNKQILDNLRYLDELGKSIEIRIPFVTEYNSDQMEKIARFLSEMKNITRIRVLAYHNYAGSKYSALDMENTLPSRLPTDEEIERQRDIIRKITNFTVN